MHRIIRWYPIMIQTLLDTTTVSSASLHLSQLILSGTSDSPGVRHCSSLASFHTHIRASSLSLIVLRPLTLSFTKKVFWVVFSGIFGCSDDWSVRWCPAKRCTFNPEASHLSQGLSHPRPPASECGPVRIAALAAWRAPLLHAAEYAGSSLIQAWRRHATAGREEKKLLVYVGYMINFCMTKHVVLTPYWKVC